MIPANEHREVVRPQYYWTEGRRGMVRIDAQSQIAQFLLNNNGEWPRGVDGAASMRLDLSDFAEDVSGIPWSTLAGGLHGYTVILYNVEVRSRYDEDCIKWFRGLGCAVVWPRNGYFVPVGYDG